MSFFELPEVDACRSAYSDLMSAIETLNERGLDLSTMNKEERLKALKEVLNDRAES